jgi:hypothetical protein
MRSRHVVRASDCQSRNNPEAEFLDEIQTKVLRVFLRAIHSPPLQLCLEISISTNSRNLSVSGFDFRVSDTVESKGRQMKQC